MSVDVKVLEQLFTKARTFNGWQEKDVSDVVLQDIYDAMKWGATSANCCPLRVIFVKSEDAKAKLKDCLDAGNVKKTMSAPVCAIFIQDNAFYDHFDKLFPHADVKSWFVGNDALIASTSFRNSSLQAAYFMLSARLYGVDCGPMSGFDAGKVKQAFFPEQQNWQANMLCNLGYGDESSLYPRSPRFDFAEVCKVV
jgi:3-hydroxypropanoate dehydrogenase